MSAENALKIWAEASRTAGAPWYLFRETLLCAAGYRNFPDTLTCPQIAVFGRDLAGLAEDVFPRLPREWELDTVNFARGDRNLLFRQNNKPVLELCILYGMENEGQAAAFDAQAGRAVRKVGSREVWHKLGALLPVYRKTVGKSVRRSILRLSENTFRDMLAMKGAASPDTVFYWDSLTNKSPAALSAALFGSSLSLTCNGTDYPVFSGYREYLTKIYGDYETGLTDEIGCGLTAADKEALKTHQARSFQALAFLEEVSREFGLRYYLLAGSVLGCVRHGGFIPWDDDIDVGIRIEELERFEEVVKEQLPKRLPKGFTLMQSGPNNPYPRMFSKICYDGRCCIDLWPLVPTYNQGLRAEYLWYFAKLITKVHYEKIGHEVTKFRKPVKILDRFLTDKMVMALARRNERKYAHKLPPAYINLYSIYRRHKETIQRTWLDTEATANFQGLEVPVVGCTEEYLTHMYGNYMAQPAPWNRASRHFARFYPTDSES